MNKFILCIQALAIFCAALVLSLPVTSAMNIKVFMPGGTTPAAEFAYVPGETINKTIEIYHEQSDIRWENVWLKASVVSKDLDYEIKKIYFFICKDMEAAECSSGMPIEAGNYLSGDRASLKWGTDIEKGGKANFMTLVYVQHGGRMSWVGFFDTVTRKSTSEFEISSAQVDAVSLFAKEGASPQLIKNYVEEYMMAPSEWVASAEFGKVGGSDITNIYKLSGNSTDLAVHSLTTSTIAGRSASGFINDYVFLFGKGAPLYPITVAGGQPTSCSDTQCDLRLGEDPSNCCLDCGCPDDKDCTANSNYPFGLCHECGDNVLDPVENWTNCCADVGCIEAGVGFYCDKTVRPPYGKCVNASCGDGMCEPTEDSLDCAKDCHATAGKTCPEVYHDNSYYYSLPVKDCVKAECGKNGCETLGGESNETCCRDCKVDDPCPLGEYCNETISDNGECMPASCGERGCEPDESYANCCLDCSDCPVKNGKQLVCELNVCHFCGNGIIESPAESETTCCKDTGCSTAGNYCSDAGPCLTDSSMQINAIVSPTSDLDCDQGENPVLPVITVTVVNPPAKLESFSAGYEFDGVQKEMTCTKSAFATYACGVEISGDNIFPGCFSEGEKALTIITEVGYKRNSTGGTAETAQLEDGISLTVTDAKAATCNRKNGCEAENDESYASCCYDCDCPDGQLCAGTCVSEEGLAIAIDEDAMTTTDCKVGTNKVSFRAQLNRIPDDHNDDFSFVDGSQMLEYNGFTYVKSNLSGFSCLPEKNMQNKHTGAVNCEIPASVFPACPNSPNVGDADYVNPQMTFGISILGSALKDSYDDYGLMVKDGFTAKYIQGWPHCGKKNEENCQPEYGEDEVTCCKDCGCADGTTAVCDPAVDSPIPCTEDGIIKRFCSLDASCEYDDDMALNVDVSPAGGLNCAAPAAGKYLVLAMSVSPPPIGIDSPHYTGTSLSVDGYGEINLVSNNFCIEQDGGYKLVCSIPVTEGSFIFSPCWEAGEKTATLKTTANYLSTANGEKRSKSFSRDFTFVVTNVLDRDCNMDSGHICNDEIGELPNQCCPDCGCTPVSGTGAERVCVYDFAGQPEYVCEEKSKVSVSVGSATNTVDCSKYGDMDFVFRLQNMPFNTDDVKWYAEMDKDDDGTDEKYEIDCTGGSAGYEDEYTCVVSSIELPVCYTECGDSCPDEIQSIKRNVKVFANITHYEATVNSGKFKDDILATTPSPLQIDAQNIIPSCSVNGGKTGCQDGTRGQDNLGESWENCCYDCGCPSCIGADGNECTEGTAGCVCEERICTESGCAKKEDMRLEIQPTEKSVKCIQVMKEYDKSKNFKGTLYECKFECAASECDDGGYDLKAVITPKPYISGASGAFTPGRPRVYYYVGSNDDDHSNDIIIDDDWNIHWFPKSIFTETRGIQKTVDMEIHVEFTAGDAMRPESETFVHLQDTIKLNRERIETDGLVSMEENLKNIRGWVITLKTTMSLWAGAVGLCTGCLDSEGIKHWGQAVVWFAPVYLVLEGVNAIFKFDGSQIKNTLIWMGAAYAVGAVAGAIINANPPTKWLCEGAKVTSCKVLIPASIGMVALVVFIHTRIQHNLDDMEKEREFAKKSVGDDPGEYYNEGSIPEGWEE